MIIVLNRGGLSGPPTLIREGCGKSKWKFKMAFAIREAVKNVLGDFVR